MLLIDTCYLASYIITQFLLSRFYFRMYVFIIVIETIQFITVDGRKSGQMPLIHMRHQSKDSSKNFTIY